MGEDENLSYSSSIQYAQLLALSFSYLTMRQEQCCEMHFNIKVLFCCPYVLSKRDYKLPSTTLSLLLIFVSQNKDSTLLIFISSFSIYSSNSFIFDFHPYHLAYIVFAEINDLLS